MKGFRGITPEAARKARSTSGMISCLEPLEGSGRGKGKIKVSSEVRPSGGMADEGNETMGPKQYRSCPSGLVWIGLGGTR